MSFLLDTNVISELRKRRCDPVVARWFAAVSDDDLFIGVLVLGELRRGLESIRRRDPASARALDRWLLGVHETFAARILPVDARVVDTWGRINVPNRLPAIDGLMAATALVHGLTLVTRNTADVAASGVPLRNPWND